MIDEAATAAFIRAHLPVVAVPGLADVRIHKAGPASGIARLAGEEGPAPYWAWWWAGGLALAHYIQAHPECVAGRRVLDFGAGSGLVGIAAAKAGALAVVACDVDAHARVALRLNAALNGVTFAAIEGDLSEMPVPPPVDLVLGGDVFYAPEVAARVLPFLDRCRAAGIAVLLGDPWRAPLPTGQLALLAETEVAETGAPKRAGVFAYRP